MQLHPHDGFDNAPLPLRHVEAMPLAAAMSAEIRGVDLNTLTEAQFDEILVTDPLPVAMWSYTSSQYSTPDAYLFDSALSDGRYGSVNSFVDGYSDPDRIAELINSARAELDPVASCGCLRGCR